MRIDKFLWTVRLFRTRNLATDAVRRERVKRNERIVKPSSEILVGDLISMRQPPIWRIWEVLQLPSSRVGAKLVPEFIAERTSMEDLEKVEVASRMKAEHPSPGDGRPSKRDRRKLDRFTTDRTGHH